MPKECEFYLWGSQGVMYKRAASTFELLMNFLEQWIEMYLDRIIEAEGALSEEVFGWCYHSNVRIHKPAKKTVGGKHGKKKSGSRRR